MTIRFIKPWNGYQPDQIVSGLTNESALISGGLATSDTDGANDGRTYDAKLATDASGNVTGLVGPDGSVLDIYQPSASDGYFCHLYAPDQNIKDPYVYDRSGAGNNATFGTNLSVAEVWTTTSGLASTLAGSADEVLHLPSIGFDFAGGESLLFVWIGKITAPGSSLPFIGDSAGSSAKGVCPMRILADGTCQGYISSGTASFFDATAAIADGTLHSYGLVLDGVASKYATYVDGAVSRSLIGLTSRDTTTTNQFMVGNTQPSAWGTTTSIVSGTKALIILRGRTGLGLPSNYDALIKSIMMNPSKLVSMEAW